MRHVGLIQLSFDPAHDIYPGIANGRVLTIEIGNHLFLGLFCKDISALLRIGALSSDLHFTFVLAFHFV